MSANIKSTSHLFALSAQDLVHRQQLNVLSYWHDRTRATDKTTLSAPVSTPLQGTNNDWHLLKDFCLLSWQIECRDKWFEGGKRGVVKVVTGAGKTVLACSIIEKLHNTECFDVRVAVVVPTIVLMDQWYDLLTSNSNLLPDEVGRMGGGYQDTFNSPVRILVCVLNSAATRLAKVAEKLDNPLLMIVDECHRAGASQMSSVFNTKRSFILGLSATPERETDSGDDEDSAVIDTDPDESEDFDLSLLGQELGPIIYELGYVDALKSGILAKFQLHHYGLPLEPEERLRYERISREITDLRRALQSQAKGKKIEGGALVGWARKVASRGSSSLARQAASYVALTGQRKQLVYHAKARALAVEKLVQDAMASSDECRILLFHESIEEVMRIFASLQGKGLPAVVEHSKLPESLRAESLHLFRIGAARILVSARSLIEGFDVPAADVGIVVASSSSIRQRIQTLGRILRKKPGENRIAALHVLYMAETTDEMIYEKQDWASVTGAERNTYFKWDPTLPDASPIIQDGPPRRPKPTESQIDWTAVSIGETYPGAYEGAEYSADSQGNVTDQTNRIATNPQEVPDLIQQARGRYGRFRVTPRKRAILALSGDGQGIVLAGFLPEPFVFSERTTKNGLQSSTDLMIRSKADGYRISRKIPNGEAFARTRETANDKSRGEEAELLTAKIKEYEGITGKAIRKVKLLEDGSIVADVAGEQILIIKLSAGLEFLDRSLP